MIAGALPAIFVLAAVQAIIGTFFAPARMALVPRTVPAAGLLGANTLGQLTKMIAGVLGAAVTGLIAGTAGVVWPVFVADAVTFALSAVLVVRVAARARAALRRDRRRDPRARDGQRGRRRPAPRSPARRRCSPRSAAWP